MIKALSTITLALELLFIAALVKGVFAFLDNELGEPVKARKYEGFRVIR